MEGGDHLGEVRDVHLARQLSRNGVEWGGFGVCVCVCVAVHL